MSGAFDQESFLRYMSAQVVPAQIPVAVVIGMIISMSEDEQLSFLRALKFAMETSGNKAPDWVSKVASNEEREQRYLQIARNDISRDDTERTLIAIYALTDMGRKPFVKTEITSALSGSGVCNPSDIINKMADKYKNKPVIKDEDNPGSFKMTNTGIHIVRNIMISMGLEVGEQVKVLGK